MNIISGLVESVTELIRNGGNPGNKWYVSNLPREILMNRISEFKRHEKPVNRPKK